MAIEGALGRMRRKKAERAAKDKPIVSSPAIVEEVKRVPKLSDIRPKNPAVATSAPTKQPSFGSAFKSARAKAKKAGDSAGGIFEWTSPRTGKTAKYKTWWKEEKEAADAAAGEIKVSKAPADAGATTKSVPKAAPEKPVAVTTKSTTDTSKVDPLNSDEARKKRLLKATGNALVGTALTAVGTLVAAGGYLSIKERAEARRKAAEKRKKDLKKGGRSNLKKAREAAAARPKPVATTPKPVATTPTEEPKKPRARVRKAAAATPKPTPTPQAAATPKPTSTPQADATPKPTPTPHSRDKPQSHRPTPRKKAAATPKPTPTPQAAATPKPTPTPQAAATPKPTPTRRYHSELVEEMKERDAARKAARAAAGETEKLPKTHHSPRFQPAPVSVAETDRAVTSGAARQNMPTSTLEVAHRAPGAPKAAKGTGTTAIIRNKKDASERRIKIPDREPERSTSGTGTRAAVQAALKTEHLESEKKASTEVGKNTRPSGTGPGHGKYVKPLTDHETEALRAVEEKIRSNEQKFGENKITEAGYKRNHTRLMNQRAALMNIGVVTTPTPEPKPEPKGTPKVTRSGGNRGRAAVLSSMRRNRQEAQAKQEAAAPKVRAVTAKDADVAKAVANEAKSRVDEAPVTRAELESPAKPSSPLTAKEAQAIAKYQQEGKSRRLPSSEEMGRLRENLASGEITQKQYDRLIKGTRITASEVKMRTRKGKGVGSAAKEAARRVRR